MINWTGDHNPAVATHYRFHIGSHRGIRMRWQCNDEVGVRVEKISHSAQYRAQWFAPTTLGGAQ
jgi:hypothetical protein